VASTQDHHTRTPPRPRAKENPAPRKRILVVDEEEDSNEELSDQPSRKHPHASAKISEDSNNISTDEEGEPPAKWARQMAGEDHQVELLILL